MTITGGETGRRGVVLSTNARYGILRYQIHVYLVRPECFEFVVYVGTRLRVSVTRMLRGVDNRQMSART